MEETQNKLVKQQQQTLEIALRGEGNTELSKVIAGLLSRSELEHKVRRAEDINSNLVELRASYKKAKEREDNDSLEIIKGKAAKLNGELVKLEIPKSIRELRVEDEDRLIDNLILLMCWLNDMVNVEGLSSDQMQLVAFDISESCGALFLEDIMLCLKAAVRGKYGKMYNKVDASDVLSWVAKYVDRIEESKASWDVSKRMEYKESSDYLRREKERVAVDLKVLASEIKDGLYNKE